MLNIAPIYLDVSLREYEPNMPDLFMRVWLNPSLECIRQRQDVKRKRLELLAQKLTGQALADALQALLVPHFEWLVRVLGHGEDAEARWTPTREELDGIYQNSPDFIRWLSDSVDKALEERATAEKKTLMPR